MSLLTASTLLALVAVTMASSASDTDCSSYTNCQDCLANPDCVVAGNSEGVVCYARRGWEEDNFHMVNFRPCMWSSPDSCSKTCEVDAVFLNLGSPEKYPWGPETMGSTVHYSKGVIGSDFKPYLAPLSVAGAKLVDQKFDLTNHMMGSGLETMEISEDGNKFSWSLGSVDIVDMVEYQGSSFPGETPFNGTDTVLDWFVDTTAENFEDFGPLCIGCGNEFSKGVGAFNVTTIIKKDVGLLNAFYNCYVALNDQSNRSPHGSHVSPSNTICDFSTHYALTSPDNGMAFKLEWYSVVTTDNVRFTDAEDAFKVDFPTTGVTFNNTEVTVIDAPIEDTPWITGQPATRHSMWVKVPQGVDEITLTFPISSSGTN